MYSVLLGLAALCAQHGSVAAQLTSAPQLASQYSLTTSTSMPFPTATLSNTDTQSFIVSGWSLSKGKIQNGAGDLAFVQDPFPNNPVPGTQPPSGPVLQVAYPAGSSSHDTGGAQLYSLWNTTDGSQFNSMLLTYEVAFDSNFTWVKGGKLPGLRGGPDPDGCSGGSAADGSNCFSSRVMWRKNAQGEGEFPNRSFVRIASSHTDRFAVYAYVPETKLLCANSDVMCNSDGFGTSIQRGAFSFASGQ